MVLSLIRQAINMPQVAEAALSYVLFILGGILCIFGVTFIVRNSYAKKDDVKPTNGHAKVCIQLFIIKYYVSIIKCLGQSYEPDE